MALYQGVVRLAVNTDTNEVVAVKIFKKMQEGLDKSICESVEKEIAIMKLISHPHILELIDVYDSNEYIYLVMEYLEGGELFAHLTSKGKLPPDEALELFQQIISAVDYCHAHNICHRDLKPENLLLDKYGKAKIADFGMASVQSIDKLLDISCGSPHYVSPEVISGKQYDGFRSDIWSCGVVLYALLTGFLPFDDPNHTKLLVKIAVGSFKIPSDVPDRAKILIKKMLIVNPKKRITLQELKNDKWFGSNNQLDLYFNSTRINGLPKMNINGKLDEDALFHIKQLGYYIDDEHLRQQLSSKVDNIEKTLYFLYIDRKVRIQKSIDRGDTPIRSIHNVPTINEDDDMVDQYSSPAVLCTQSVSSSVSSSGLFVDFDSLANNSVGSVPIKRTDSLISVENYSMHQHIAPSYRSPHHYVRGSKTLTRISNITPDHDLDHDQVLFFDDSAHILDSPMSFIMLDEYYSSPVTTTLLPIANRTEKTVQPRNFNTS